MALEAPMRCSALAEQLQEPMIGSVAQRTRWLLLEDRSPWGHDAVAALFGSEATALAKRLGVRLLLVRRREGDPAADAVRRAILVDTVSRRMAVRTVTHPGDLSVEEAAHASPAAFGSVMSDPLFLVCTNGKRDACCALRGRALIGALAADHGERTWECTHLGGHRFAGNLVCLPDGIVYGRVSPAEGPRLADAYRDGRLDPAPLRGRSAWPAPAQVAEQQLRQLLDLAGLDDVRLVDVDIAGERATVMLAARGAGEHRFTLAAARASPPRPLSCRAEGPEEPVHWEVVARD